LTRNNRAPTAVLVWLMTLNNEPFRANSSSTEIDARSMTIDPLHPVTVICAIQHSTSQHRDYVCQMNSDALTGHYKHIHEASQQRM
jgi:hypothetical protein